MNSDLCELPPPPPLLPLTGAKALVEMSQPAGRVTLHGPCGLGHIEVQAAA